MVTLTRLLNLLSFVMIMISGIYIHSVFADALSSGALVTLWILVTVYLVVLIEMNFAALTKIKLRLLAF